ncbi:cyclin-L2 [Coccidioides immitis H538.4]|uniref:RNA polymerase II holoenzyme cyclin-like subunit n=1 Tax=Coccidioides immitis H538.4 TaxID=396776 RepID=A0A0J8U744_COCIT|nr:cyclin-L2 [Coccidioides immitis H538.4]
MDEPDDDGLEAEMEAAFVREQEKKREPETYYYSSSSSSNSTISSVTKRAKLAKKTPVFPADGFSSRRPTAITEHAASITYEVGPAIDRGGISMLRTAAARRPHFSSFCMTPSARLQAYNAPWAIVLGLFAVCRPLFLASLQLTDSPKPARASTLANASTEEILALRVCPPSIAEVETKMPSISSNKKSSTPPVPSPSNPVLLATQSQWLFTDSELLRSPSVLDGMPIESEHTSRGKGVNFIMQVGILLKLPQLTLCTASVYLHRFFMRYSMVDLPQRPGMHPYSIAATALFLATKVEENCRKMRELIIACCRVALKQPNVVVDEQSKEFWKWRDTILHNEDLLLEALCFDLQLEQPYRLLYDFLCYLHQHDNKPLRNSAWAFINDSIFTVLCLQFTSRTIAASALYAAARHCDVSFDDDILGRPWWEQLDVELRDLKRACNRMAELYERSPLPKPGQSQSTY